MRSWLHMSVIGVALCWTAALCGWAAAEESDLRSQIDSLSQPLIDDGQAVGLVVGFYKDGKQQFCGYGETVKGNGVTPDEHTIYEIGSVSKAFTGVLLAQLVESGAVKLADPLQKYVPSSVKVPVKDGKPITLEHLATHTSGLPRLPANLMPKDWTNPYADYTAKQMHAFLAEHELRRPPGEYEYSNYGMGLLGYELARNQKTSYEELLIDRIVKPLRMTDTRITLSKAQRERLAAPYDAQLNRVKNWDTPVLAGAGAIRSTAEDMLKFAAANLADDEKPLTKALRFSHEKRHMMPDGGAIGLGWHLAGGGNTCWHNGMTGGYASWLSVVPKQKVGVVVLSNTATDEITELGQKLTRVAFGAKVEPPKKREAVKIDSAVLERYIGVYAITPEFALAVTVEDGKLMVQATGQGKYQVFPESATKFFYRVVDAQLTFEADKDGKVNELILHQNGSDQVAKRQE